MKKYFLNKKFFVYILVFVLICSPLLVLAQGSGLVPCGRNGQEPCGFYDLIKLINKVFDFIFKDLAIPLAAILFAYAGFLLLTSGGDSGKKEKAKGIFFNVVIGLLFVAGAWLLVKVFLDIVGYTGESFFE